MARGHVQFRHELVQVLGREWLSELKWVQVFDDRWTWQTWRVYKLEYLGIPSGIRLHNYGKSPFFMGKSTISMAIFNSYVSLPEGTLINRTCSISSMVTC